MRAPIFVGIVVLFAALGGCRRESAKVDARRVIGPAHVPGLGFAAVNREREVVVGGEGVADVARKIDANGDTVFEAASIAKLIVAVCVMQMVEDKKLEIDTDVGKYVGFSIPHPVSGEPITLRMLLQHRAGIRDRNGELTAGAEGNSLGVFLKKYLLEGDKPRAAAFSDKESADASVYSNVGVALAAFAVERVSGESFAKTSARRVFAPLRMTSTSWTAAAGVATPYTYRDAAFVGLPQASHAVYPVVDLRSSARDLGRFARAILRDGELDGARVLSASSVRTMLPGEPAEPLVWQLRTIDKASVVGHEGEDAGASTALFLDLARGTGAVVLANGDAFASGDKTRIDALASILPELLAVARPR